MIFEFRKLLLVKGVFVADKAGLTSKSGVRISHLDPETRMNSRDEFRQGTNIMMRAMRGVGV